MLLLLLLRGLLRSLHHLLLRVLALKLLLELAKKHDELLEALSCLVLASWCHLLLLLRSRLRCDAAHLSDLVDLFVERLEEVDGLELGRA